MRASTARRDAIIDVEVVGNRAGAALWTRDDLDRHPFLRIDQPMG